MLKEIYCDKFESHGQPRPPITFHAGLNTILGDKEGTNSIGKSTFLLIIDFAFGGEDYLESNALTYVGDHTIHFTFEDSEGNSHYFCRQTNDKKNAFVCDSNRTIIETITIDAYRKKLAALYGVDISFRKAIGLYLRIYGRENHNERKPLHLFDSQKFTEAITDLQQLFGESQLVKDRKAAEKAAKATKDTYKAADKEKFITVLTTKKAKTEAEKKREELAAKLKELIAENDKLTQDANLECSEEAATLKRKLQQLRRKRSHLLGRLRTININLDGLTTVQQADIDDLEYFFPSAKLKELRAIQHFHRKIQTVLSTECQEECQQIRSVLDELDNEIRILENEYHQTGIPVTVSTTFLDRHTELSLQIRDLDSQIASYDRQKAYKDAWSAAKKALEEAQAQELPSIEKKINSQMTRYNDIVMGADREAPTISFGTGKTYTFGTTSDDGTGNNYKNLIVFDMSVLALTQLPAVIHDSFILKDIGDASLENIIQLYTQTTKQVFIALDKASSYRPQTETILESTKVLYLSEDDNQLFGWSWNKKTT